MHRRGAGLAREQRHLGAIDHGGAEHLAVADRHAGDASRRKDLRLAHLHAQHGRLGWRRSPPAWRPEHGSPGQQHRHPWQPASRVQR
ncbi:Uncharacterised protein [Bordetella pertussis]|nr:Uncharacterised protein [Bordetella pertussis]